MNINWKKTLIIFFIVILVLVLFSFFSGDKVLVKKSKQREDGEGLVSYVNAQGEDWEIKKGNYEFNVSSNKDYPKIISGSIDPLDVKPGNLQNMKIVVNSDFKIEKAWAEIETDKEDDKVDLNLVSTSTVAKGAYEKKLPFVVNDAGVLELRKKRSFVFEVIDRLFKKVDAEDVVTQYTFKGDWVVHDTHNTTYKTKFIVKDINERKHSIILAWSDPGCNFSGGALFESCTADGVEGYDGGAYTLNGHTVTLGSGDTLVFNEGNGITINGSITMSGGSIDTGYLYLPDVDGDSYVPPNYSFSYGSNASAPSDKIRAKDTNTDFYTGNNTDCDDDPTVGGEYIYREVSNLSPDVDHDGYVGGSATTECVGNKWTSPEGWEYYQYYTGNYDELDVSYSQGSDCDDSDGSKYTNVWGYTDSDGDGYGTGSYRQVCSNSSSDGVADNGNDCYDSNSSAHPNQSSWFTTDRGDGSYDYDCDGSVDYRYTAGVPDQIYDSAGGAYGKYIPGETELEMTDPCGWSHCLFEFDSNIDNWLCGPDPVVMGLDYCEDWNVEVGPPQRH